jgi:hypothetical protein
VFIYLKKNNNNKNKENKILSKWKSLGYEITLLHFKLNSKYLNLLRLIAIFVLKYDCNFIKKLALMKKIY